MTLYVDPRAGSGPLLSPLRRYHRLPVKSHRMHFGDFAWQGSGPNGPVRVGIEFKLLPELLSSITSKRLISHQLPGLVRRYPYRYLLVEGIPRPSADSSLEVFRIFSSRSGSEFGRFERSFSSMTYPQLARALMTFELLADLRVKFTSSRAETLAYIASLYHWWQKPWSKHHAHLSLPSREDDHPRRIEILFRRPSVLRRIASCLPGIGWTRSAIIASRFRSVSSMVDASRRDWANLPGIGPKTAQAVWKALRGQD